MSKKSKGMSVFDIIKFTLKQTKKVDRKPGSGVKVLNETVETIKKG